MMYLRVKLLETESERVGWGGGNEELLFNGYKVSVCEMNMF